MAIASLALERREDGFALLADGRVALVHTSEHPCLYVGKGEAHIEMHHGNFAIEDDIRELCPLTDWSVEAISGIGFRFRFSSGSRRAVLVTASLKDGRLLLHCVREEPGPASDGTDRVRIVLPADGTEHVYGAGEQFSYLDLRGRKFPLWTSEQGVGRNRKSRITLEADLVDNAGGDYWWTFYPQPTFVSSAGYWVHMETTAYALFDFRKEHAHELYCWELPESLVIGQASSMPAVLEDLTAFFGRQGPLPEWCYQGVILGIQGGTHVCEQKLARAREAGVPVAGIWAQDWEGINITSFGQRLRWNWQWNRERYPDLDKAIRRWRDDGVRFLAYANCYLGRDWPLCREAAAHGYLVKNLQGEDYYVDFGEFYAGIVDLTNPAAFDWFADTLKRELIDLGTSGWMADFGEYLPIDAVLFDGTPAIMAHNAWPALWARCNHEAVRRAGAQDEVLYFMRAGFTGSQRWCPMLWAGDQNVDWSSDDGLPSAVRAALGVGMSGHGLHHSDIGGYTTLFGLRRTKELFMRWAEQAAFSPLMRTHEGNRPSENWQFDSDEETLAHLATMGRVHVALAPYLRWCVAQNSRHGLPVMRPLFLHYPQDREAWTIDHEYLLGPDLLVAPVMEEGARKRTVHFPPDIWRDFWSGELAWDRWEAGELTVDAPLGRPPVFIRKGSAFESILLR